MGHHLLRQPDAGSWLGRFLETPSLLETIPALPPADFAALVRRVGVADAGELVALATTEQLVAAFDEDLFLNRRPGERETFDAHRFALWLEILLEAGEPAAAARFAELSRAFVIRALGALVLVLDRDALEERLDDGPTSRRVDKAIESSLSEELDGYLVVARVPDAWDAVWSLLLALDRDHRELLEAVLERAAALNSGYLDRLDRLAATLTEEEALAEEVEGERDERRARIGHVEPRDAKAFLALARAPLPAGAAMDRDPITRAYFRELARPDTAPGEPRRRPPEESRLPVPATSTADPPRFVGALHRLVTDDPATGAERLVELGYLANALAAGATVDGRRLRPAEAAATALATVAFGAELMAKDRRGPRTRGAPPATIDELEELLRVTTADGLFRLAGGTLVSRAISADGTLTSLGAIPDALARCT